MRISDWSSDVCSSDLSRAVLRCREADIDPVSERLGIILPRAACRSAHDQALSALWLGPDEWLMMSTEPDDGWANGLSARLDGVPCSLVDVSHRQVGLSVHGPRVEDILATGCALDLSIAAFPIGMCTRTMFAKAEVRSEEHTSELQSIMRPSYAHSCLKKNINMYKS